MSNSTGPKAGAVGTASCQVQPSDLASTVTFGPDDVFPNVFATARLVALMEVASARVLTPHLKQGQLSVGVNVDIVHSAPTPVGCTVTARATFRGREAKLYVFDVVAEDEAGEVGRCVHKRAVVEFERIEEAAKRRLKGRSKL